MPTGMTGLYPKFRADDADGNPLEGGRLYSFLSGTTTPYAMYADPDLTTPLSNPIVLDASGEALFYSNGTAMKWRLDDANDVPLWTIDPVYGGGGGGGLSAGGMGLGTFCVALTPAPGAMQAAATVFPPHVLGVALTVWVETTLGLSQGLTHVGVGIPQEPDRWGVLVASQGHLTAGYESTAGLFTAYSGQPQPLGSAPVTLTAYGGLFDGTGRLYLTGHYLTFHPNHQEGSTYLPGIPGPPAPFPPLPPATEDSAGVVELLNATEVLADTDLTRAVTMGRLVTRTGTPSRVGLLRTATPAAVVTGTNDTDAATPLGVTQALAAKVPNGTPLSVAQYASSGQTLQSSPLTIDATGNMGLRTTTPATGLHVVGDSDQLASVRTEGYHGSVGGVGVQSYRARGTQASPAGLQDGDIIALAGQAAGYVRNAGDTAHAFTVLGNLRLSVDGLDAQGRAGGKLNVGLSPGVSAATANVFSITSAGNVGLSSQISNATMVGAGATRTLALGPGVAPTTSPTDTVQLTAVDRGGTAGKRSLQIRTEDGTSHILGDRVGLLVTDPAVALDIGGDTLRLRTARTPASATAAGDTGSLAWDATHLYVCVAPSTWRRVAHASW